MEGRTSLPGPHEEGVLNIMPVTTLVPLPCHLPTSVHIKALAGRELSSVPWVLAQLHLTAWQRLSELLFLHPSICSWVWSFLPLPWSSSPVPWCYDLHSLVLLWFDLILQLASNLQSRCLVLIPQQLSKRAGSSVSLLSNPLQWLPLYQFSACLHILKLSESWCLLQPSCNYFAMVTKRILMTVRCIMCDIRVNFTI